MHRYALLSCAIFCSIATSDTEDLVVVPHEDTEWNDIDESAWTLDADQSAVHVLRFSIDSAAVDSVTHATAEVVVTVYGPDGEVQGGQFALTLYNELVLDEASGPYGAYTLFGEDVLATGLSTGCIDDGVRCWADVDLALDAGADTSYGVYVTFETAGTGPEPMADVELVERHVFDAP